VVAGNLHTQLGWQRPALRSMDCSYGLAPFLQPQLLRSTPRIRVAAHRPRRTHAVRRPPGGTDDTVPHGWHYYWKATYLHAIPDEVIDMIVDHFYRATSPRTYALMFHMEGAVVRVPNDATAYSGRDVPHNIIIDAAWLPDQADEVGTAEREWARAFLGALEPHRAKSVYVNFLDADDDTSRIREAYGDHTYRRLAEVTPRRRG
jgi:hypothetical protein